MKRKPPSKKLEEFVKRPIPAGIARAVEILRDGHANIDPRDLYVVDTGGTHVLVLSGLDLIESAKAFVALHDAHKAGDADGMAAAFARLKGSNPREN